MKKIFSLLALLVFITYISAQKPQSWSSAEIYQAIKKLNVLGSVLYVAAHPDDENTRLIAYLSKDKLYRTGYLALTRGDGGQNLIGDEQGIELGLIRTQELLAARRNDGGEQFFTRAFDFGYSKNPEETFTKWDREKILSDVVWVIRKFQPDVIVTRFPVTGEGGHGHHTASAILANEAFKAAADPNRFPEQLQYVKPWQAKRILWNTFNFGGTNTTKEDQLKIDVGGYNPLLGKSYGEIAAESRSQHKSQGFGVPASRGTQLEYFATTGGAEPKNLLTDGIDISWNRIPGGKKIAALTDAIAAKFDLQHPEKSVNELVKLYKAVNELANNNWKVKKLNEIQELIQQCSGLWLEAFTTDPYAVQTDSLKINLSINNRLGAAIELSETKLETIDTVINTQLKKNDNVNFSETLYVSLEKQPSQPYWLAEQMGEGYYEVADTKKIGQADIDTAYTALIKLNIYNQVFNFKLPVMYKYTDPVKGEIYGPLYVLPPATTAANPSMILFNNKNKGAKNAGVYFHANKNIDKQVNVELRSVNNKYEASDKTPFAKNKARVYNFILKDSMQSQESYIEKYFALANYADKKDTIYISKALREINHDHIPAIKYLYPDYLKAVHLDLETSGEKIGYITGAGDKVPEALEQMGYKVTVLTEKEMYSINLDQFDAVISGIRAYNTNDWMSNYYDKLMKYIENGGNYIVQYNTSNFVSSVSSNIGPYNFTISRNRITDEKAKVNFLNPGHAVLNYPNKITENDFKDWIQERSIYDAIKWDKNFEPIFSMNDPGDKTDEGSLIIAKYGKGYFTYTGLVFFRELPAGVPGAYRLLANIIALNRKKAF